MQTQEYHSFQCEVQQKFTILNLTYITSNLSKTCSVKLILLQ